MWEIRGGTRLCTVSNGYEFALLRWRLDAVQLRRGIKLLPLGGADGVSGEQHPERFVTGRSEVELNSARRAALVHPSCRYAGAVADCGGFNDARAVLPYGAAPMLEHCMSY